MRIVKQPVRSGIKIDINSPMRELKRLASNTSKNLSMNPNRQIEEADRLMLRKIEEAKEEEPVGKFLSFVSNKIEKINEFVKSVKKVIGIEIEMPKMAYKIEERVRSKGVVPEGQIYVAKEVEGEIVKAKLIENPRPNLILMCNNPRDQILVANPIEEKELAERMEENPIEILKIRGNQEKRLAGLNEESEQLSKQIRMSEEKALREGFISRIFKNIHRNYIPIEKKREFIDKYFENLKSASKVNQSELARQCGVDHNFFSSLKHIPRVYKEMKEELKDRLPSKDELKARLHKNLKDHYYKISQGDLIEYYIEKYNKIFPTGKIICSDAEGISEKEKVRALREGFISPLITDQGILIEKKREGIDEYFKNLGNGSKVSQSELARQYKLDPHFFTVLKHIPRVYKEMKEELKDRLPSLDELKNRLKDDLKNGYHKISQDGVIEYYIKKYNEKYPEGKIICSDAEGIGLEEKAKFLLRKGFISKISVRSYKSIEEKKFYIDKYFENLENGSKVFQSELARQYKLDPHFFPVLKHIPKVYKEIREKNPDRLPSKDELKNVLKNDLKNLYSHISHGDLIEYYIEKYNKKYPEVKIICSDAEGISEKEKGNALLRKGFISKISIRSYKSIEEKKFYIDKYFENLGNGSKVSLITLASECKIAPNFFSALKKISALYEEIREGNSDKFPSKDELKARLKKDLKNNYSHISQGGLIEYYIEKYNEKNPYNKIILSE